LVPQLPEISLPTHVLLFTSDPSPIARDALVQTGIWHWGRALAFSGTPNDRELHWSKSFKISRPICWPRNGIRKNRNLGL